MTEQKEKKISRRDAIKLLGAAIGATTLTNLPSKWSTPELVSGVLPAHAQTSQSLPTVLTVSIAPVGSTGVATFDGNVTNIGLSPVTAKGFVWSTVANPTLADNVVNFGSGGLGAYQVANVDTTDGILLYGRAYATNTQGTAYGNQITFQTGTLPTVSTVSIVAVGTTGTATFDGNVTNEGSSSVTAKGFVWSTVTNPTLADNVVNFGSGGLGAYQVANVDTTDGILLYGRAYATSAQGTIYGNQITFQTDMLPTVSTDSITDQSNSSQLMNFSGTVISDGGTPVTARGFVWSTSANPTLPTNNVSNGSGIGSFTSTGVNTTPNVTIYLRAYATNSVGTAYGLELNAFNTICLAEGTLVTMADGTRKRIESIQYSDLISVWNFDEGHFDVARPLWIKKAEVANRYNLLEFSDGSSLKTINQHRIFNKELGAFTYPMTEDTPIGTTTFNVKGEQVTLVNKCVVNEQVNYYNVITHRYMNLFADGILTSCRYNNIYPIIDMKFVKDDRKLVAQEEYGIEDKYYEGLRLAEQTILVEATIAYIQRLRANEVEAEPIIA